MPHKNKLPYFNNITNQQYAKRKSVFNEYCNQNPICATRKNLVFAKPSSGCRLFSLPFSPYGGKIVFIRFF
jgi:hypothetical protein